MKRKIKETSFTKLQHRFTKRPGIYKQKTFKRFFALEDRISRLALDNQSRFTRVQELLKEALRDPGLIGFLRKQLEIKYRGRRKPPGEGPAWGKILRLYRLPWSNISISLVNYEMIGWRLECADTDRDVV